MRGTKDFSKIKLTLGYHQVHIKEEDGHTNSFKTWYGNYKILVVPFGIMNEPTTFMCLMNSVFSKYLDKFLLVFIDDIFIYSKTEEEQEKNLRIVLQTLIEDQIYDKYSKCEF